MIEQNIIVKYVPNFVTLLSLSSGFTSISFSLNKEWEIAIYLILLATVFDFFDGWFARKLKSGSNFGAELDSLSDFVSFGVAPSVLIYLWSTNSLGSLGWGATLFFVICSSLRLARFTADIYITNKPIDDNEYFVGIPSPAAAGLILLPLFIFFEFNIEFIKNEYLNLFSTIFVGFMMISKIPTLSLKKININQKFKTWIILIFVFISVALVSKIWLTLILMFGSYIASIFFTILKNRKTKQ
ncbi:MAG: CDP-diacylglycerol--serine O-phosphatidyltransferase [Pelagibacteraceae bacterium]|jgi:CDP-diacylglycerol--serine O-phosphatidyltransferase|nr:CDP-diacylglycerol--serine O-phosphatidyltransferase [Pelagibacteraceae bacterium]MBT3901288.1 CDP-diacylglycerol--serine O-phosphatidyltransferase [Pelagibacteraceae bacterium]MBT4645349.1 CDP-diacylglycerol--serine O-phosphatidyltransferase [Pelagibacteraceae bacterium]MBT4951800.1 CDP-diacylglycerol--serine O-phosphatidyltransferase [Pelagibacteraceae bacterium]MBT5214009.1 CDP-diacylglycerol--serine O-phosphatidyltransferase [Pelagibacteraceae bacterium]